MSALDGIRILDFTRILAGPFCTMMLADMGADVIKIEQPGRGDDTRHWGPPWVGDAGSEQSAYYASINRNKRSVTLNLKHEGSRDLVRALVSSSHILIENFRPGQMGRYGLGYDSLRQVNPALVYCAITGYGQTPGPYRERPGYDSIIQAMSGLMSITGQPDGPPTKVGVAITDIVTGLNAATAILAALRHSERTGEGQFIDIALLDSQIAALVNIASNTLVSSQTPQRMGDAHPNIVPYQTFTTGDDRQIAIGVGSDAQFIKLCEIIQQPTLADHPDYATNPGRVANRDRLIPLLEQAFRQFTLHELETRLNQAGIPSGPINDVKTMLEDEHVAARGLLHDIPLDDGSQLRMVGPATKFSATPPDIRRPPPALGQHTDEILGDVLGLDADTIARYHAGGLV